MPIAHNKHWKDCRAPRLALRTGLVTRVQSGATKPAKAMRTSAPSNRRVTFLYAGFHGAGKGREPVVATMKHPFGNPATTHAQPVALLQQRDMFVDESLVQLAGG